MRIAVLVKQVPQAEAMTLGPDGHLVRQGVPLEMNAFCRRAVAKGVEVARLTGGSTTVFTLGPPSAADVLREAIAWGADRGVHLCDPRFAGSDSLATAEVLAAALRQDGPFDLVLAGRNAIDAETGQVGPTVAGLLDLPFVAAARELILGDDGRSVLVQCEEDDGESRREVDLPAAISTAERLCQPCKHDLTGWSSGDERRIAVWNAEAVGVAHPGTEGSQTVVEEVRLHAITRSPVILDGDVDAQVDAAIALLRTRGALDQGGPSSATLAPRGGEHRGLIAAVGEEGRPETTRELTGAANQLAATTDSAVAIVDADGTSVTEASSWGADELVRLTAAPGAVEEDFAAAIAAWTVETRPWAVLFPSTSWGREVAARVAARTGAGLVGDAIGLVVAPRDRDEMRLVAHKPAFSGRLVADISWRSPLQMVTVRPGTLPPLEPRPIAPVAVTSRHVPARGRVRVLERTRNDDVQALTRAERVVGVGTGVELADYGLVHRLAEVLDAELAASRRVSDNGWQPRARQVGLTGRSIAPTLYVAIGISGKFNHMVGVRQASTILAINNDRRAPVFEACDIGIVASWTDAVMTLVKRLEQVIDRS